MAQPAQELGSSLGLGVSLVLRRSNQKISCTRHEARTLEDESWE